MVMLCDEQEDPSLKTTKKNKKKTKEVSKSGSDVSDSNNPINVNVNVKNALIQLNSHNKKLIYHQLLFI